MGRWSQNRRRGGGPPAGTGAIAPAQILAVLMTDTLTARVYFDRDVLINGQGSTPDGSFQINDYTPDSVFQAATDSADVTLPGAIADGSPWAITGAPNWTDDQLAFPASGSVAV